MTQQIALEHIHPRRGFFAAVAELIGVKAAPRPRPAATAAPFDPELHLHVPFALLTGPR